MTKRKLKPFVVPVIYIMSIAMLIGSVYFIERIINNVVLEDNINSNDSEEVIDVVDEDIDNDIPVVNTDVSIIKPYTNDGVSVANGYYDYKGEASNQEKSILYYGDTYMQNSGIDYTFEGNEFDVVSILDGTIMEIIDDEIMGKTVKIQHSNDLVSVYQSLGSVEFKVNDSVGQGTIIGKSGSNNVSRDLGNHLHFELYYKGNVVNPDLYYGKFLGELG